MHVTANAGHQVFQGHLDFLFHLCIRQTFVEHRKLHQVVIQLVAEVALITHIRQATCQFCFYRIGILDTWKVVACHRDRRQTALSALKRTLGQAFVHVVARKQLQLIFNTFIVF